MRERFYDIAAGANSFVRKFNPDLYSVDEARYALSRVGDKAYTYGSTEIRLDSENDRSKIWSLNPQTLKELDRIIKDAGNVFVFPYTGMYNMDQQKIRMADVALTDAAMIPLMALGFMEGFASPFLRGYYALGRKSWWRHQSIMARHHHQMTDFLEDNDERKASINGFRSDDRLHEAGNTLRASGVADLLTKWQTLKEARGSREKIASGLAIAFYFELVPFLGMRNMFTDAKEEISRVVDSEKIQRAAMMAAWVGLVGLIAFSENKLGWSQEIGQAVAEHTPFSTNQVSGFLLRSVAYASVTPLLAAFSVVDKGAFGDEQRGNKIPTKEYKFPYTYSPVTSVARSIGFLHYLNRVWDQIPNYRLVESAADIEKIKREINQRLDSKTEDRQKKFTMEVLEDALSTAQSKGRTEFPKEVYVKGMFIPALYLRLREMYG